MLSSFVAAVKEAPEQTLGDAAAAFGLLALLFAALSLPGLY